MEKNMRIEYLIVSVSVYTNWMFRSLIECVVLSAPFLTTICFFVFHCSYASTFEQKRMFVFVRTDVPTMYLHDDWSSTVQLKCISEEPIHLDLFSFLRLFRHTIALRNWTHERTSIPHGVDRRAYTPHCQRSARNTCCLVVLHSIVCTVYYGFCSVIYKWNECSDRGETETETKTKKKKNEELCFVWSYMRELIFSFGIRKFVRATWFATHTRSHRVQ